MVAQIHRRNVDIVRPCRPASLCTAIFNIRVDPLETRFELSRILNLDSCLSRAPGRVGDRSAQSSKSSSSSRGAPAPAGCGGIASRQRNDLITPVGEQPSAVIMSAPARSWTSVTKAASRSRSLLALKMCRGAIIQKMWRLHLSPYRPGSHGDEVVVQSRSSIDRASGPF